MCSSNCISEDSMALSIEIIVFHFEGKHPLPQTSKWVLNVLFMPKVSFPYHQTAEQLHRHYLQSKGEIFKFPLHIFVEVNLHTYLF